MNDERMKRSPPALSVSDESIREIDRSAAIHSHGAPALMDNRPQLHTRVKECIIIGARN